MEDLEKDINEKLNKIKEMIKDEKNRDKIEEERKQLDQLLQKYLKDV